MLCEGFLERVGWFAFAFEVFGVVFLQGSALGSIMCIGIGERVNEEPDNEYVYSAKISYHARPSLVSSPFRISFNHHIRALLILKPSAIPINHSRWHQRHAIKRVVPINTILNFLPRRRSQCFPIRICKSLNWCGPGSYVACQERSIIGAFVMVSAPSDVI